MIILKRFSLWTIIVVLAIIHAFASSSHAQVAVTEGEGWIQNPTNGHYYKLTDSMSWSQAEEQAIQWGGHLVTINDREEELWLTDQFGANEYFWIGFNDISAEGNWEWVSGEPVTYTNWWAGEPNNQSAEGEPEDAAIMNWGGAEKIDGKWVYYYGDGWNDNPIDRQYRGIVEVTDLRCDFSSEPGIERCFGGIGKQCEGFPIPFIKDEDTCLVYGWMSVGSILHDRCCVETNNTGFHCANPNGTALCIREWREAKFNTICGRFWPYTFGPYPAGNTGDDINQDLRAPVGARVRIDQQDFCPSGKCLVNAKGKTIIKRDQCGRYCECQ